jgi:hypothetical protein
MHAGQILYFRQMSRIRSKKANYKCTSIFNTNDDLRFTQEKFGTETYAATYPYNTLFQMSLQLK